jgi:hypothetical protein
MQGTVVWCDVMYTYINICAMVKSYFSIHVHLLCKFDLIGSRHECLGPVSVDIDFRPHACSRKLDCIPIVGDGHQFIKRDLTNFIPIVRFPVMGWMTINHIPCFAPPAHRHSHVYIYIYTYPTPSKNLETWGIMATTLVFQVLWVLGGSDYIRICGYRYKHMHLINVYIYIL